MKKVVFAAMLVGLAGCGGGLSGTYGGSGTELKFHGSDVDWNAAGIIVRGHYKVDGKNVVMTFGQDTRVMPILANGCLDGPLGTLCKS